MKNGHGYNIICKVLNLLKCREIDSFLSASRVRVFDRLKEKLSKIDQTKSRGIS